MSGGEWPQVRIGEFRATVKTLQTLLCCNSQGVTTAQIWSRVSPPSSSLFLSFPHSLCLSLSLFFRNIPLPERAASLSRSSERICHVKAGYSSWPALTEMDLAGTRGARPPTTTNKQRRETRRKEQRRRMKSRFLGAIFQ